MSEGDREAGAEVSRCLLEGMTTLHSGPDGRSGRWLGVTAIPYLGQMQSERT